MTLHVAQAKQPKLPSAVVQYGMSTRGDENTTGFSTSYVIEFARARTNHINSWLNTQLQRMQEGARDSQALNDVLAEFARHSEGSNDSSAYDASKAALKKAIEALPPGSPLAAKLIAMKDDPGSPLNDGNNVSITKEEMAGATKQIESMLKTIDQGSQEGQLLINQKLGEKSEILQLAAMLIQQCNEVIKSIQQRG